MVAKFYGRNLNKLLETSFLVEKTIEK